MVGQEGDSRQEVGDLDSWEAVHILAPADNPGYLQNKDKLCNSCFSVLRGAQFFLEIEV